jgi:hypothetical protein
MVTTSIASNNRSFISKINMLNFQPIHRHLNCGLKGICMKKISSIILGMLSLTMLAQHCVYAANCGPYLGAGVGYGLIRTPNKSVFAFVPDQTNTSGGLSGRVFAGYNVTSFFGIEGGYARYARSRYTASLDGASTSLRYYVRTADIVAKLYLPVGQSPLNLYALAGAVSYWEQIKLANDAFPTTDSLLSPTPVTTNQRRTRPIYGLGIALAPFRHFTTNVEYTWIQNLGNFKTNTLAIPTTNLATWNFAYNF